MAKAQKQHLRPPQHQAQQPGIEETMQPRPQSDAAHYQPAGKLVGKTVLISGGDSGIGKAASIAMAKEGANIVMLYLNETRDAKKTQKLIEQAGASCLALAGDIGDESFCRQAVRATLKRFGAIDVLINNAAEQHPQDDLTKISARQLERTFRTNVFGMFFLTKAALNHLENGATIINTTSVTAFRGSPHLLDYSSTKGAIVAFTRSLAKALAERGIRVNGVAPGPIWTPLIPASFDAEKVATFGSDTPMGRPGQPDEIAPCFVFLASRDSSYMTGQILHPNGGDMFG